MTAATGSTSGGHWLRTNQADGTRARHGRGASDDADMARSGRFILILVQNRAFGVQEAFEKCWAHSPLRAAARRIAIYQVSVAYYRVARRLRIDVYNDDDDDDNA